MKELSLQSRVIDAVVAANGAAEKISHKYIRGVCDLLIKLPNYPPLLAEVKAHERLVSSKIAIGLEVTPLQRKFLYKFENAGMDCCIMSFMLAPLRNYQMGDIWVGLFPAHTIKASLEEHTLIPKHQFNQVMVTVIERWFITEGK